MACSQLRQAAAASRRGARSSVSWGVRMSQRSTTCRTISLSSRSSVCLSLFSCSLSRSPCTYKDRALYASLTAFVTSSRSGSGGGGGNRGGRASLHLLADAVVLVVGARYQGFQSDDVVQVQLAYLLLPDFVVAGGALVGLQEVTGGPFKPSGTFPGQVVAAAGCSGHDSIDPGGYCDAEGPHPRQIGRREVEAPRLAGFKFEQSPASARNGLDKGWYVISVQLEVPAALDSEHGIDVQKVPAPQKEGKQRSPVTGFRPRTGGLEPMSPSAVRRTVRVRGMDEGRTAEKIEVELARLQAIERWHGAQLLQFVGSKGLEGVAAQRNSCAFRKIAGQQQPLLDARC
ncbi:hypothetical protein GA0115253_1013240 [Streptomyces sp. Termitarium-T10T-6]|nr:hypothetical protein GA0115253_1013240 [Streptomyces sp. Termitarium-T10T-6]